MPYYLFPDLLKHTKVKGQTNKQTKCVPPANQYRGRERERAHEIEIEKKSTFARERRLKRHVKYYFLYIKERIKMNN